MYNIFYNEALRWLNDPVGPFKPQAVILYEIGIKKHKESLDKRLCNDFDNYEKAKDTVNRLKKEVGQNYSDNLILVSVVILY